jgi:uncharacterized protein (DUF1684 family)
MWSPGIVLALTLSAVCLGDDYSTELQKHRADRDVEYKTKASSPFKSNKARRKFKHLNYFEADQSWIIEAEIRRFETPDTLQMPTSAGTIKDFLRWAELHFEREGKSYSLEAYRSIQNIRHPVYSRYLFIPFTDLTSGAETYGGGRYLDIEIPAEDADVMQIDFNYAYNPYCAYSDGWFCPIPPARNFMEVAVQAGEKNYGSKDSH